MIQRALLVAVIAVGVLIAALFIAFISNSGREQAESAAPENQTAQSSADHRPRRSAAGPTSRRDGPHAAAEEATAPPSPHSTSRNGSVAAEGPANRAGSAHDRRELSLTQPKKTGATTHRYSGPNLTEAASPGSSSDAENTEGRGVTAP